MNNDRLGTPSYIEEQVFESGKARHCLHLRLVSGDGWLCLVASLHAGPTVRGVLGSRTAEMIRYAPLVKVMKLAPPEADDMETIQIQGEPHGVSASKDITATPGLVHARQALIEDASFLWNEIPSGPSNWQYVLRFADGDQQISVALDCDQGRVLLVGTDRQTTLKPHLATAYQSRLPKWLGVEDAEPVTAAAE